MSDRLTVSHPTGNANVRNVLQALEGEKLLDLYQTTLASFASGFWHAVALMPGFSEVQRREYHVSLRPYIHTAPVREICRLLCLRLGLNELVHKKNGPFSIDRVYQGIDRLTASRLSRMRCGGVYCYEDAALHTFQAAKAVGKACFYDLPIGYWRAAREILIEESERRPEWRPTMGGLDDSSEKLARKDDELRQADRILVASSFTKKTLEKCPFPIAPVSVIPYGADEAASLGSGRRDTHQSQPLKVLFVGGLSQRKGIADLFEAVDILGAHVELTVIGRKPSAACQALDSALRKHRWIASLPREQVLQEMHSHDVLVFPSLFEGFGLVVTEALSQGLPVITTPHTCGPDVLTDGEEGFIVPIRDPRAIAEKLELLHRDRERLRAMSEAARKKAEALTWESYRQGVVAVVRETLATA